jgi:hypothetical protein
MMEDWSWLVAALGGALVLLVLVDTFLTVLHVDRDGPIASLLFHAVWTPLIALSRQVPTLRRSLVGLAAPAIMVTTFAVWMAGFILGFGLVYWPFMEQFRADEGHAVLGFAEALYFSGVTATVLGYGDVTPTRGWLQVLAFIQSGLGFALLTGIITYLINVVAGVADRNALSFQLWLATGRTGDGTRAVIRSLAHEGSEGLLHRLQLLVHSAGRVHQKMRQFPILDVFYRSRDPVYSPELMLRTLAQVAVAARIAAADRRHGRLIPAAQELGAISGDLAKQIAAQHLSGGVQARFDASARTPEAEAVLEEVRSTLTNGLPGSEIQKLEGEPWLLELLGRTRILLDELDRVTGWRMDDPATGGRT